jgi:hypothetical protein
MHGNVPFLFIQTILARMLTDLLYSCCKIALIGAGQIPAFCMPGQYLFTWWWALL